MIFEYAIKYKGKIYPSGTDVPIDDETINPTDNTSPQNKVTPSHTVTEETSVGEDTKPLTIEDIENTNNVLKLKAMAKEHGITLPKKGTLAELQTLLIKELNL